MKHFTLSKTVDYRTLVQIAFLIWLVLLTAGDLWPNFLSDSKPECQEKHSSPDERSLNTLLYRLHLVETYVSEDPVYHRIREKVETGRVPDNY